MVKSDGVGDESQFDQISDSLRQLVKYKSNNKDCTPKSQSSSVRSHTLYAGVGKVTLPSLIADAKIPKI